MRWITGCILVWVGLLQPGIADACSCERTDVAVAFKASDAVFSGRVVDVQPSGESRSGVLKVTFQVAEVWKGIDAPTVSVVTPSNSAACGYGFTKGKSYLVYAYEEPEGKRQVSLCSQTKTLESAKPDFAILGKSARQFDPPAASDKSADAEAPTKDRCSVSPGSNGGSPMSWVAVMVSGLVLVKRRGLAT